MANKGNGNGKGVMLTLGDYARAKDGVPPREGIVGATLDGAPGKQRLTGISLPAREKPKPEVDPATEALQTQSKATIAQLRDRINRLTTGVLSDDTGSVGELCGEVMMLGYVLAVLHRQGTEAQQTYDARMEALLSGRG
jgi:hypothetical protein